MEGWVSAFKQHMGISIYFVGFIFRVFPKLGSPHFARHILQTNIIFRIKNLI